MCESCGCGQPGESFDGSEHAHAHGTHEHGHRHEVPWVGDLLEHNRTFAAGNRSRFLENGIGVVNVLGSPGAGKTSLLAATIDRLADTVRIGVITGDLAGDEDGRSLTRPGVAVHQIQTGRVCHLDAHMVEHALDHLPLDKLDLLFIENVGNLVCPASFDLGETRRAVVLSVTEGDDKPSKYPEMFQSADAVVLSKMDLMPYARFRRDRAEADIRRLRSTTELLPLSVETGDGVDAWLKWLAPLARRG